MMRLTFPIAMMLLMSACSSGVETRIVSSGAANPTPAPFMISTVAETSEELRAAYALVAKNMAGKGFALAKEAPLHLEITLDARAANLALDSTTGPLSPAKKPKPLQSCVDKEYRLGVTLTQVGDGVEIYRGRAAEYHCKMSLKEALPILVNAALADMGQPRGSYVVKRQAQD
jgi:hypothetical protein